jgi:hypothetical protein
MAFEGDIPFAESVEGGDYSVPQAFPVDDSGHPTIPELHGRTPTHNEAFLIGGGVVTAASSNVKEFWWHWQSRRLFVEFLNGTLGYYNGVSLSTAVKFIETDSPGRFVHNYLKDNPAYPWTRIVRGTKKNPARQVVRLKSGRIP